MNRVINLLSRREFLLAAGLGSAGAAAAVVGKRAVSVSVANPRKSLSRGYQESDHVSNYYRTTRL